MSYAVVRALGADGVFVPVVNGGVTVPAGYRIVRLPSGPAGVPARQALAFMAPGPYAPRQLIVGLIMDGDGEFDATFSRARALTPCAVGAVWSATLNGTFADPDEATGPEIAAALFATITFPAGAANAAWAYPAGGAFADGDILRVWEGATPDATQANTSVTFSGA